MPEVLKTCSKCGHPAETHIASGCHAMVGNLECKCYRPTYGAVCHDCGEYFPDIEDHVRNSVTVK